MNYILQKTTCAFIIKKKKTNSFIIPSYDTYDNYVKYEILEIVIGTYLSIQIKKNLKNNKYIAELTINKPNDPDLIIDLINKIYNL